MISRPIVCLATWLSRPAGFLATAVAVSCGLGVGLALGFSDRWALVYNTALSVAALLATGIVLVAGARDTAALQAKCDEIIRAIPQADDRLIGLERQEEGG